MRYMIPMVKGVEKLLAARKCRRITDESLVPSAVLLLLFKKGGTDHVLFTKRSDQVEYHKGEISFPGGRVDADDAGALDAALREATEEIGVAAHDVTILGRLDDTQTSTTGFIISPFVGRIPYPYPFRINRGEIAELIFVPLCGLAEDSAPGSSALTHEGRAPGPIRFHYQGHTIWGATARILKQFLDIIAACQG
jgi:8-oxo-dGTP pyrophosphatase MutT (NUDIX family)